jgi:hypothetical protein
LIELAYNEERQVLLVSFRLDITTETLNALDEALAVFVAEHGATNTIIDFSDAGKVETSALVQRGNTAGRMAGKRRIFVAPTSLHYGMFRLYGSHQENRGDQPPEITPTLADALTAMGVGPCGFEAIRVKKA